MLKDDLNKFSANIGKDPLLVQGAGGNISIKVDKILHVKASGTCLSDAEEKDIFVPVDIQHVLELISSKQFDKTPKIIGASSLRPSIETFFHALLPHKVVVHVHSVETLSILIQSNAKSILKNKLGSDFNWAMVGYHKPGSELAHAVHNIINKNPDIDVIFLKNHGLIVGGKSFSDVESTLTSVVERCKSCKKNNHEDVFIEPNISIPNKYSFLNDGCIQALALDSNLFKYVNNSWAIAPDHVVFLGDPPSIYLKPEYISDNNNEELIFIKDVGVIATKDFNKSKKEQLRCFFDVVSRLPNEANISLLGNKDIAELLNWDAEKYRQNLSKKQNAN